MTDIENPFVSRVTSADIIAQSHERSLRLLRARFHQTVTALDAIAAAMPNSSMHKLWEEKVAVARAEFLDLARNLGLGDESSEQALAEH